MRIIVNRGFNNLMSRIMIYKKERELNVSPINDAVCEFEAIKGERIIIKLKLFGSSSIEVASLVCGKESDEYYISPTFMCEIWEIANYKLLPYLCILFLVLQVVINSDAYEWFCAGFIVLVALSLILLQLGMLIPGIRSRLYKVTEL